MVNNNGRTPPWFPEQIGRTFQEDLAMSPFEAERGYRTCNALPPHRNCGAPKSEVHFSKRRIAKIKAAMATVIPIATGCVVTAATIPMVAATA